MSVCLIPCRHPSRHALLTVHVIETQSPGRSPPHRPRCVLETKGGEMPGLRPSRSEPAPLNCIFINQIIMAFLFLSPTLTNSCLPDFAVCTFLSLVSSAPSLPHMDLARSLITQNHHCLSALNSCMIRLAHFLRVSSTRAEQTLTAAGWMGVHRLSESSYLWADGNETPPHTPAECAFSRRPQETGL